MELKILFCLIYILQLFKDNLGSPLRMNGKPSSVSHSFPYQFILHSKIPEDLEGRFFNFNPFRRKSDLLTTKIETVVLLRNEVNKLKEEFESLKGNMEAGSLKDHPSMIYRRLIRRIDSLKDKALDLLRQKGKFEIEKNIKEILNKCKSKNFKIDEKEHAITCD